jgi:hypothetical protein
MILIHASRGFLLLIPLPLQKTSIITNKFVTRSRMTIVLTKLLALDPWTLASFISGTSLPTRIWGPYFATGYSPSSTPTFGNHSHTAYLNGSAGGAAPLVVGLAFAEFDVTGPFLGAGEVVDVVAVFAGPHFGRWGYCVDADEAGMS